MMELDAMLCSMDITTNAKTSFTCHSEVINLIDEEMVENVSMQIVKPNLEIGVSDVHVKKRRSKSNRSSSCDIAPNLVIEPPDCSRKGAEVIDLTETEEPVNYKNVTTRRRSGRHPRIQSVYDVLQEIKEECMDLVEVRCSDGSETAATESLSTNVPVRRSLRKRVHPLEVKVESEPKMRKRSIEQYYCDKRVKRLPSTLETIFEEPKQQNNEEQLIGTRKYKRTVHFHQDVAVGSKLKLRKRILKAKKLPSSKTFLNRKKIPLSTVMQKLSSLDSDNE
ncbi:hypothetical protein PPYR_01753 [Photinus pyralis]|uniref:Tantalus-like domain-containing protein n=1 Tax=Photinus pyralis TaxID=7054 RepID=A0A1Y1MED8_PHOPY|nr:uncharacterized protein LOC116178571 [Photinus pyralis]KAB0804783.1 hypothetical protein PPYR_01753 [Photinus pyralis]